MKKLLFLILMGTSINSFGQWNDGDTIQDFLIEDINGVQHDLYSHLDDGKVVMLDFFFPACMPCWKSTVKYKTSDMYSRYGEDGSDQIRMFGVDVWGDDPYGSAGWLTEVARIEGDDVTLQNLARGDYEFHATFPILPEGGAYGDSCLIQYAPTYMLVCPDRRAYQSSPSNIVNDAQTYCNVTLTEPSNSVRIYLPELSMCSGYDRLDIKGHLRNTGNNDITSARVKLMVNGTVLATQDLTFSGSNTSPWSWAYAYGLPEFTFADVLIDQPLGSYGKGPYKVIVDKINGIDLTTPFEKIVKIKASTTTTQDPNLTLELKTDNFGSETSWELYNSNGTVLYQENSGTLQSLTTTNTPITIQNNGCHTLRLKDSYGDGMINAPNSDYGYLKIKTSSNVELCDLYQGTFGYENFGYDTFFSFMVGSVGAEELGDTNFSIYPNPVRDQFRVETENPITIDILDVHGKLLLHLDDVHNAQWVDISGFASGVYFAHINNGETSQVIEIVKE